MSNRTITIILAVLVVLGVIAYFAGRKDKSEPTDTEQPSRQTRAPSPLERMMQQAERSAAQRSKQRQQPPSEPAPLARITIDGRADDWVEVPAVLIIHHDRWSNRNYKCKAVKLARDEANRLLQEVRDELEIGRAHV